MRSVFITLFFCLTILSQNSLAKQPLIAASINPIYQIILAITQDKSNLSLIIDPNFSEHDYQLKNSDIKNFQKADLVFYISNNLEYNIEKLVKNYGKKNQSHQLIEIFGIKILPSRSNTAHIDQHIWLNPENAIKIAEFITKRISEFDSENAQKYQTNLTNFTKNILATKDEISKNLTNSTKVNFSKANYLFYHDGYQYFEDYFAVRPIMLISANYDQELTIKTMKEIDLLVKSKNVKCIFGDLYDEKNSAQKLAEKYNLKFFTLDLMGSKNNQSDSYSILLLNIAKSLESCF